MKNEKVTAWVKFTCYKCKTPHRYDDCFFRFTLLNVGHAAALHLMDGDHNHSSESSEGYVQNVAELMFGMNQTSVSKMIFYFQNVQNSYSRNDKILWNESNYSFKSC